MYCKTPKFEEFGGESQHPSLKLPCECIISITTDGINYSECEETFKIYNSNIFLTSVAPKAVSVKGGAELSLDIDIDSETAKSLFHLIIGFQPKNRVSTNQSSRRNLMQSSQLKNQSIENTPQDEESKYKALNASNHSSIKNNLANAQSSQNEGIPINPLDVNLNDNTIDSENWVCAAGHYEHKRIV